MLIIITLLILISLYATLASANPEGGEVVGGAARINLEDNRLTITQETERAIINWKSFDIAVKQHTHFTQPSSSSVILNRVSSDYASRIDGGLTSNGNIIIVNPNGMIFGPNSVVDVGGLIASTTDIRNDNFLKAGSLHFNLPGHKNASIISQGKIDIKEAGVLGFVAPHVNHSGVINSRLSKVKLSAGERFTLDMYGDELITLDVTEELKSQSVTMSGIIENNGGTIELTAAKARGAIDSIINIEGKLIAKSVEQHNGKIMLLGRNEDNSNKSYEELAESGKDILKFNGTIEASSHIGLGGKVMMIARDTLIFEKTQINADGIDGGGEIYAGGDYKGGGTLPTASRTYIAANTKLSASVPYKGFNSNLSKRVETGNGGKVIVWGNDHTIFNGEIKADGGAQGRGGFVETSGKILNVTGIASAKGGKAAGQWLLDPNNITISTGGPANINAGPNFASTGEPSALNVSSITTALNAGTNVSVTTASAAPNTQSGFITVADNITTTAGGAGGNATLNLIATNAILIDKNITSTAGKLNIILNADSDASGAGYIRLNNIALTSLGGNITLGGGATPATLPAVGGGAQAEGISIDNATIIDAGGGNIILNGKNSGVGNTYGVYVNASTVKTSGTGTIAFNGSLQGASGRAVQIQNSIIETANGNMNLTGDGSGAINTSAQGLAVDAASKVRSTGSGNVNITGIGGTGNSGSQHGIYINFSTIQSQGGGNVTITGTSTSTAATSHGILYQNMSNINSATGNVTLIGSAGAGGVGIYATSNSAPTNAIGLATSTGNITLQSDTMNLDAQSISTKGNLYIVPKTVGGYINLGTSGVYNIFSQTQVNNIATGKIYIGDTTVGKMTVSGAYTWPVPTIFTLQAPNRIDINTDQTTSGTGAFTFENEVRLLANLTTSASNGAIIFNNILNLPTAGVNRTLSTGTGDITFGGAVTTNNNTLVFAGSGLLKVGANITTIDTPLDVNRNMTLTANSIIDTGTAAIKLRDVAIGTNTLTLAGTGALQLNGAIGSTNKDFTVNRNTTLAGDSSFNLGTGIFTLSNPLDMQTFAFDVLTSGTANINANITSVGKADGSRNVSIVSAGSIALANNIKIESTVDKLNIILNSNSGGAGGGITLPTGSKLTSLGGNITLGGGADPLNNPALGVAGGGIGMSGAQVNAGGGDISIRGQGANDGGNTRIGINMNSSTQVTTTGTGKITIAGEGGNTNSTSNSIYFGNSSVISTVDGDINITAGTSGNGLGFYFVNTPTLKSTGSGNITVNATVNQAAGGSAFMFNTGIISVNNGNLTLTGTSKGNASYGLDLRSTNTGISSTGTGTITLTGITDGAATYEAVHLTGAVESVNGDIIINGTTTSNVATAPAIYMSSSTVKSTGTAKINITGTGGNGTANTMYGLYMLGAAKITSVTGDITVTGTSRATGSNEYGIFLTGGSNITSTGSAKINLTAVTPNTSSYGIYTTAATNTIGGASAAGNIILKSDTMNLSQASIVTSGAAYMIPNTAGTAVTMNTGGTSYTIPTSVISGLSTSNSINVGDTNTGALTISSSYVWPVPTIFTTNGANITMNSAQTASGTGKFSFKNPAIITANLNTTGGTTLLAPITFDDTLSLSANLTTNNSAITVTKALTLPATPATRTLTTGTGDIKFGSTVTANDNTLAFSGGGTTEKLYVGGNVTSTNTILNVNRDMELTANSIINAGTAAINLLNVDMKAFTLGFADTGGVNLNGNIASTNTALDLGTRNLTLTGNSAINTGTGSITLNSLAMGTNTFSFGGGGKLYLNAGTVTSLGKDLIINRDTTVQGDTSVSLGSGIFTLSNPLDMQTFAFDVLASGTANINANITSVGNSAGTRQVSIVSAGNIILASGVNIKSTTDKLNIILTSNSGAAGGEIQLNGLVGSNTYLTSKGGNITLSGALGLTGGGANTGNGINLVYAQLAASGGNISANGTGVNDASNNRYGINSTDSQITTSGSGTIALTGIGGAGAGNNNYGINIASSTVQAANGAMTLTGTGQGAAATNYGISLNNASNIASTGSSAIKLIGSDGGSSLGIKTITGANIIGGASATGDITLQADRMDLANLAITTTGKAYLIEKTAANTMNLATAATSHIIAANVISSASAAGIYIGAASTGDLTVSSSYAWPAPTIFTTKSTNTTTVNSAQTTSATGSFEFATPAIINANLDTSGSTAAQPIKFDDTASLAANLTTANGALIFTKALTLTGGATRTLTTGSGDITFGSDVTIGTNTLVFSGAGTTEKLNLGGNIISTDTNLNINRPTTLTADSSIDTGTGTISLLDLAMSTHSFNFGTGTGGVSLKGAVSSTNVAFSMGNRDLTLAGASSIGTGTAAITLNNVTMGVNALTFTGTGGLNLGGDVKSTDINLDINRNTNLIADSSIDTGTGTISLLDLAMSTHAFNFGTGTGGVSLKGAVSSTDIAFSMGKRDLTLTGNSSIETKTGTVTLNNVAMGTNTLGFGTGTGAVSLKGAITSTDIALDFANRNLTLAGNSSIETKTGVISLNNLVMGTYTFDFGTGTGGVNLKGAVSSTDVAFSMGNRDLTLAGASSIGTGTAAITLNNVTMGVNALTFTGTGGLNLGGDVKSTDINLDINRNTALTANSSIDTGTGTISLLDLAMSTHAFNFGTGTGGVSLKGAVSSTDVAFSMGKRDLTLTGNSTISTNTGDITLNSLAMQGFTFSLAGAGTTEKLYLNEGSLTSTDKDLTINRATIVQGDSLVNLGKGNFVLSKSLDMQTYAFDVVDSGTTTISNVVTSKGDAAGTRQMLVKARGSIILDNAGGIKSTQDKLKIILNADSDNDGTCSIKLAGTGVGSESVLDSKGGDIILGAGLDPLNNPAIGDATNPYGVELSYAHIYGGGGNVSIRGKGYSDAGLNRHGVYIHNSSLVSTAGSGNLTINGQGGTGGTTGDGIRMDNSKTSLVNGVLNLTGTAGDVGGDGVRLTNAVELASTGTANMTLIGSSTLGNGIKTDTGANVIGGGSNTGNITLQADNMDLANFTPMTSSNVYIKAKTATTAISMSSGATNFKINPSLTSGMSAANLYIGDSTTGPMTLSSSYVFATPVAFTTNSTKTITVSNKQTTSGNGSFEFVTPALVDADLDTSASIGNNKPIKFADTVSLSANLTTGNGNLIFTKSLTLPVAGQIRTLNTGNGSITFGNGVLINNNNLVLVGSGGLNLAGAITSAGTALNINRPTTLTADSSIDLAAGGLTLTTVTLGKYNLNIMGGGTFNLSGDATSTTGSFTTTRDITLNNAVTIDNGSSGTLNIKNIIAGNNILTVKGSGIFKLDGNITSNNTNLVIETPITLLSNSIINSGSGNLTLAGVAMSGNKLNLPSTGNLYLKGNYTSNNVALSLGQDITLKGDTLIDTGSGLVNLQEDVNLDIYNLTVKGNGNLTLGTTFNSTSGHLDLQRPLTLTQATTFNMGSGNVNLSKVMLGGALTLKGSGNLNLGGDITGNSNLTFNMPTHLVSDITVDTNAGDITFNSSFDNDHNVDFKTTGTLMFRENAGYQERLGYVSVYNASTIEIEKGFKARGFKVTNGSQMRISLDPGLDATEYFIYTGNGNIEGDVTFNGYVSTNNININTSGYVRAILKFHNLNMVSSNYVGSIFSPDSYMTVDTRFGNVIISVNFNSINEEASVVNFLNGFNKNFSDILLINRLSRIQSNSLRGPEQIFGAFPLSSPFFIPNKNYLSRKNTD